MILTSHDFLSKLLTDWRVIHFNFRMRAKLWCRRQTSGPWNFYGSLQSLLAILFLPSGCSSYVCWADSLHYSITPPNLCIIDKGLQILSIQSSTETTNSGLFKFTAETISTRSHIFLCQQWTIVCQKLILWTVMAQEAISVNNRSYARLALQANWGLSFWLVGLLTFTSFLTIKLPFLLIYSLNSPP